MRLFLFAFIAILTTIDHATIVHAQEIETIEVSNSSDVAVIFVHGFTGDENSFSSWPYQVALDDSLGEPSVFLLKYPGGWDDVLTIPEISNSLELLLGNEPNVTQHEKYVFVAHSMGGLVVREMLVSFPAIRLKTKAALFLASPFQGTDIADNPLATFAEFVTETPSIGLLSSNVDNHFLSDLRIGWNRIESAVPSYCAYETKETRIGNWYWGKNVIIVNKDSASEGCNRRIEAVHTNHRDIATISAERKQAMPQALLQRAFIKQNIATLPSSDSRIIAIDSFRYGEIGSSDEDDGTNYYEIREILNESLDYDFDVMKLPSSPIGWDASVVSYFDPSVIVMHWSTFEAGEDCYVNGSNFDSDSCQRLAKNIDVLLENSEANMVLYTRTPNACADVPAFFKSAMGVDRSYEKNIGRIRVLDLPLAATDRAASQRYLENDSVKSAIQNVVAAATNNWSFPETGIRGVCEVYP